MRRCCGRVLKTPAQNASSGGRVNLDGHRSEFNGALSGDNAVFELASCRSLDQRSLTVEIAKLVGQFQRSIAGQVYACPDGNVVLHWVDTSGAQPGYPGLGRKCRIADDYCTEVRALEFPENAFPIGRHGEAPADAPLDSRQHAVDLIVRSQTANILAIVCGAIEIAAHHQSNRLANVKISAYGWTLDVRWIQPVAYPAPITRGVELRLDVLVTCA